MQENIIFLISYISVSYKLLKNNSFKNYEMNITISVTFVTHWEIQVTGKTTRKNI
jgi:hypothetical protein